MAEVSPSPLSNRVVGDIQGIAGFAMGMATGSLHKGCKDLDNSCIFNCLRKAHRDLGFLCTHGDRMTVFTNMILYSCFPTCCLRCNPLLYLKVATLIDAQPCSTTIQAPNGVQAQSRQHRYQFGIPWAGQLLEDCLLEVALQT